MELELEKDGTANILFGMHLYVKEKPKFSRKEFDFRKMPSDVPCDKILDTGSPEMPMRSYSWQVLDAPDICGSCAAYGAGGIDLVLSQGPVVPLTPINADTKWPVRLGTYHDPLNNLLYIGEKEYQKLKSHGQIKRTVQKDNLPLLGFHKGSPIHVGYLELLFRYTGDPEHDNSASKYLISEALRFTNHMIENANGIGFDGHAWYRKGFDVMQRRNRVFWRAQRAVQAEKETRESFKRRFSVI